MAYCLSTGPELVEGTALELSSQLWREKNKSEFFCIVFHDMLSCEKLCMQTNDRIIVMQPETDVGS